MAELAMGAGSESPPAICARDWRRLCSRQHRRHIVRWHVASCAHRTRVPLELLEGALVRVVPTVGCNSLSTRAPTSPEHATSCRAASKRPDPEGPFTSEHTRESNSLWYARSRSRSSCRARSRSSRCVRSARSRASCCARSARSRVLLLHALCVLALLASKTLGGLSSVHETWPSSREARRESYSLDRAGTELVGRARRAPRNAEGA